MPFQQSEPLSSVVIGGFGEIAKKLQEGISHPEADQALEDLLNQTIEKGIDKTDLAKIKHQEKASQWLL